MSSTLLQVQNLDAFYGDFQALHGLELTVEAGEVVAVIGANGAGKTTLMKSIAGLITKKSGTIELAGAAIQNLPPYRIVEQGIALVPEGRRLFSSLTMDENLMIGGQLGRPGPWSIERVFRLFPALAERRGAKSTALSGGQQQMVAIGRALMSNPRLLLCDELSLGLAPIVVQEIYQRLPEIVAEGTSVVIVEQDVQQALKAASHAVCLQEGRVALAGKASELTREAVTAAYFGV